MAREMNQHQLKQTDNLVISKPIKDYNLRIREKAEAATKFLNARGYQVSQRNGQRITINLAHPNEPKKSGCEIFIGKLPRNMFEDEIIPLFEWAGTIHKIRLMMDFSGTCRGFCFVKYLEPSEAELACLLLDNALIRPDEEKIGVSISFDNRRLYFGNLPTEITKDTLQKELGKILEGITDIEIPEFSPDNPKRFAFVTFESHEAATNARRVLIPNGIQLLNHSIEVEWAKPEIPAGIKANKPSAPRNPSPIGSPALNVLKNFGNLNLSPIPPPLSIDNHHLLSRPLMDVTSNPMVNEILGDNARRMIETDLFGAKKYQDNTIIVTNINPNVATLEQLRIIFQLANRLTIVDMCPLDYGSISITYDTADQANLMLETLILMPRSFDKLAIQNRSLLAFKKTLTDLNANYQVPLHYY